MGRFTTIFCLALFVFTASAQKGSKKPSRAKESDGKIVGGERASMSDVPFLVSLQTRSGHPFCGGSLISPEWVLTAAHCTDGQSASAIRVVAGTDHLNSENQVRSARTIVDHPGYNPRTVDNDIALIRLSSPVKTGGSSKTEIVELNKTPMRDTMRARSVLLAGFGTIKSGGPASRQLLKVEVPGVTRTECKNNYRNFGTITENMICAGHPRGGVDSCQGDSGGPAVLPSSKKQVGVVSWGKGCAEAGYPGVYAEVARYVPWIERQTGLSL